MEYKITNFDVATEKLCLEQTAELPIEADFSAADYLGEIKKVLKCRITPFIINRQISGNALTVEGSATVSVMYCDQKGLLYTAETEVPFKKTFEAGKLLEGGCEEIKLSATTHSAKAITERRLSVRGSVKLEAAVNVIEKKEIISDIDSDLFELLKGDAPATTPLGNASKSIIVEEDISLPDSHPAILNVLRSSADILLTETKIISNKAIIKGFLKNEILYCTAKGDTCSYTAEIPFSQIMDMVGISEECNIDATPEICSINLTTRTNEDGTCRSLLLTGKLLITAKACCNSGIPIILDTYCTKYTAEVKKEEVAFTDIALKTDETFLCKKKLKLAGGSGAEIIDLCCSKSHCTTRFEEKKGVISGGINVTVLSKDEKGDYFCADRIIDFEYPINADFDTSNCRIKPEIDIKSSSFSVIGADELELKIELNIKSTVYRKNSLNLITAIDINDTAPLKDIGSSLIAYYADKGEKIWEIAKSFLASKNELLEINNLKTEEIDSPKMLLIPRM